MAISLQGPDDALCSIGVGAWGSLPGSKVVQTARGTGGGWRGEASLQCGPAGQLLPPHLPSSEGFKPNQQPFCVKHLHLPSGKGAFLALLAITDLQCTLLKEQGLGTEFTLDGAEGAPLFYMKEKGFILHSDFSAAWLTSS